MRVTITIATTAKTPAHRRQLRLNIGDGDDTASREAAARREAEAVQRDATQRPWRDQRGGVEDRRVRRLRDKR